MISATKRLYSCLHICIVSAIRLIDVCEHFCKQYAKPKKCLREDVRPLNSDQLYSHFFRSSSFPLPTVLSSKHISSTLLKFSSKYPSTMLNNFPSHSKSFKLFAVSHTSFAPIVGSFHRPQHAREGSWNAIFKATTRRDAYSVGRRAIRAIAAVPRWTFALVHLNKFLSLPSSPGRPGSDLISPGNYMWLVTAI